jgi:phage portal protein BeeE
MSDTNTTKAADGIELDSRQISSSWVGAGLLPGEAAGSRYQNNTGRDYDLVSRGVTGTAWRAASINATVVSQQTLRLFRVTGTGTGKGRKIRDRKKLKWITNEYPTKALVGKAAMYASRAGDEIEEVISHPVLDLLQNPDPVYTGPLWMWLIAFFKEVAGRAYLYVGERGENGPASAYILPSEYAWPMLSDTGLITGYFYGRNRASPMRIAAEEVIYLRQHGSPIHPAGGVSWLSSVIPETDMEGAALQAEAARWMNGGMPGMVLRASPNTTDSQMKQIYNHLAQQTRGVNKAGGVLLLRDTEVVQYGTKPHEMQYVEGITTTEKRIYDAAGIPEPIYRLNSANLASATVANAQYMRYTIAPRLAVLAAELTELLLPHFGIEPGTMWFCFDNPTQDDQIQMASELRAAEMQGLITPNEYRKVMDLEALPEEANALRYRQTEAPAPAGIGIFGPGPMPAPAKASEMPSADMGSMDVEAPASVDQEPEAPASVDLEPPAEAPASVDMEPEEMAKGIKASDGYAPNKAMMAEAERGLAWRREYGRGGTEVGVARARDIANGKNLSEETVYRMASYFARHAVDKQGTGWSPGDDGYPSAGRIAWALWGGDPGRKWADGIIAKLEADTSKTYTPTQRKAAPWSSQHGTESAQAAHGARGARSGSGGDGGGGAHRDEVPGPHAKHAGAHHVCGVACGVAPTANHPKLKTWKAKGAATIWDEETGTPVNAAGAYRTFTRKLTDWYTGAVPSMINDVGAVQSPSNEALAQLTKISEAFVEEVLAAGAMQGLARLGLPDSETFNTGNEIAMAYVRNRGLELATTIPETLKGHVAVAIEKQLAAGTSAADLRDAIKDVAPDLTEWQAVRVARTETATAFCEGQRQAWAERGVEKKQWLVAGGPCPICDAIVTKYPNEIPIGEAFVVDGFIGQSPAAHPNCRCDLAPGVEYEND